MRGAELRVLQDSSTPVLQYPSTPGPERHSGPLQYSSTPALQYSSYWSPVFQFPSTPGPEHATADRSSTPVRQYSSTPVLQYSSAPVLQCSSTPALQDPKTPQRTAADQRESEGTRRGPGRRTQATPQRAPGSYTFCCGAEPPRPLSNNSQRVLTIKGCGPG